MTQVKNVPILKNGKVVSYFSGDDAELTRTAASLGGQPGTPTGLSLLPEGGESVPSPYTLPGTKGKTSPLLSFADSLDAAVNLARKKRNASSLEMMKPFQGTVAASDFNSILSNLNQASDQTSSALIKRTTDITTPDIITSTDESGNVHGIDKNTGNIVWTAPGVGNRQGGGTSTLVRSGNLEYTREDYSEDASQLEQSRGSDGWVDPTIYQKLYDAWVSSGGKIADFVKTYPPEQYVNPENDWLPVYLRPKKSGIVNPFAQ